MRLSSKLLLTTLVPPVLIWAVGLYVEQVSEENLREAIKEGAGGEVRAVQEEIDRLLRNRASIWMAYARTSLVQDSLKESNASFAALEDPEGDMAELERLWTTADPVEAEVVMRPFLNNPLAEDLKRSRDKFEELAKRPVFGEVFITNKYGANVAQTNPTSNYLQRDEDWWLSTRKDGLYISDVHLDRSAEMDGVEVCTRIEGDDGSFLGILKAVMSIREIFEVVDSHAEHAGSDVVLALITSDGRLIRIGNRETRLLADGSRFLDQTKPRPGESAEPERMSNFALPPADSLVAHLGWVVVQEAQASQVLARVRYLRSAVVLISIVATLVGMVVMGWIVIPVSRRIGRMADATEEIAKGNFETRIAVTGRDELSELSREFNSMTAHLETARYDLLVARDIAEDASRAKGEFLANMSHEIRTPMNAILGMTELMEGTALTDEQREYQKLMRQSAESLLLLLNDILDYSKIEAGKLELEEYEFDLRESLGDILQTLAPRSFEKGLELACWVDAGVPVRVLGDLGRLRQVLVNLVGNAIKFTEEGEILLMVEQGEHRDGRTELHFMVRDTGIGIPEDRRDEIFESFSQADSSTTRKYGGTGLGLTISRRISEKMGGRIWVESEVGAGSVFHVTGWFGTAGGGEVASIEGVDQLRDLPVLLVDDNATSRTIESEMLAGWGMRPMPCEGAEEALAILDDSYQEVALVLADSVMPGVDGIELASRIREQRGEEAPPIIMLNSVSGAWRGDDLRAAGVSRTVSKPVKPSSLLDAILLTLGLRTQEEPREWKLAAERPKNVPALRLLLAEDGKVNQVVAVGLLERRGHSVKVVENGKQALEALEAAKFDAVLMDVQMPVMNGFEATAAIREREAGWGFHVPVIAMTAHAMPGDREECLARGMDAYIAKPIESRELYEVVERSVGGERSAAPESGGEDGVEPGSGDGSQSEPVVFDASEFRERIGDPILMGELLVIFEEDCDQLMQAVADAYEQGESESLHRAAHALKGMLGNYCAARALQRVDEVDRSAREGRMDGLDEEMRGLGEEVDQLREALRRFHRNLEEEAREGEDQASALSKR